MRIHNNIMFCSPGLMVTIKLVLCSTNSLLQALISSTPDTDPHVRKLKQEKPVRCAHGPRLRRDRRLEHHNRSPPSH